MAAFSKESLKALRITRSFALCTLIPILSLTCAPALAGETAESSANDAPSLSRDTLSGSLDCNARQTWLHSKFAAKKSIFELIVNLAKNANVTIFGESHVHYDGIAQYPQLLAQIKKEKPAFNCLFIEGKDGSQSDLDAYQFGGKSYDETIKRRNSAVPSRTPLAHATKPLMDFAKASLITVFAVDTNSDSSDVRNKYMAERIATLMKGKCNSAVFLVGKMHLEERLIPSHPKSITPIPDRLRAAGLSVATVNLLSHAEIRDDFQTDCKRDLEIPKDDFSFSTVGRTPAINKPFMDVFQPAPWSTYDAALVIK